MSEKDSDLDGFDIDFNDTMSDSAPVKEVYGSIDAIEREGSPLERADSDPIRYYFYPTWRSQVLNLCGLFLLFILTVVVSRYVPALVVAGSLFSLGDTTYFLHLPVLTLIPGALLGKILINIYDAKYIIDDRGVEAQIGLVSMNLRQPRLRWEDIRGVEPNQTIWERLLGIGSVLIGSAMTQDVEIVMSGVANPRAVQLLIGGERDRRLAELQRGGGAALKQAAMSE
jgi:uncharacterized membrane protein YdbT with pleckstrin-like domain